MTTDHDIDRALEALFRPGPSVMPDRFLDGVLERVERVPQRRLARLQLRYPRMRHVTLLAAVPLIVLLIGAGALVAGRPSTDTVTRPSATSVPQPTAAPPSPVASPPSTRLTQEIVSSSLGYALMTPDGFRRYAATEPWDPAVATEMTSPWLDRIRTADNVQLVTARSTPLEPPMDSAAWLAAFERFPGSPAGDPTCMTQSVEWTPVEVDGRSAYEYHEHCGPTWLVVSSGERGYVFTWRPQIDDTPESRALYDPVWEAIRGSIDLDVVQETGPDTGGPGSAPATASP